MSNVLIRDVPEDELVELKAAAAARSVSLQSYLLEAIHSQAVYVKRQAALAAAKERLAGRSPVSEVEREAVLEAVRVDLTARAEDLADRAGR